MFLFIPKRNSLNNLSEIEIYIEKIKQNIKEFVLEIEKIKKIYSQDEYIVLEYLKAEKDSDYMSANYLIVKENIRSTSKDLIPIDCEIPILEIEVSQNIILKP